MAPAATHWGKGQLPQSCLTLPLPCSRRERRGMSSKPCTGLPWCFYSNQLQSSLETRPKWGQVAVLTNVEGRAGDRQNHAGF